MRALLLHAHIYGFMPFERFLALAAPVAASVLAHRRHSLHSTCFVFTASVDV